MFIRQYFKQENGQRTAYWALVESYRTATGPRQRVVAGLGKLDEAGRLGVLHAAEEAKQSAGQHNQQGRQQRGYSRDHRSDCKQVCIAQVVSKCGMPLGYEVFAGNTADVTTVEHIVELMERRYGKSDRIWVMDRVRHWRFVAVDDTSMMQKNIANTFSSFARRSAKTTLSSFAKAVDATS